MDSNTVDTADANRNIYAACASIAANLYANCPAEWTTATNAHAHSQTRGNCAEYDHSHGKQNVYSSEFANRARDASHVVEHGQNGDVQDSERDVTQTHNAFCFRRTAARRSVQIHVYHAGHLYLF
jgi:hypothetical protein